MDDIVAMRKTRQPGEKGRVPYTPSAKPGNGCKRCCHLSLTGYIKVVITKHAQKMVFRHFLDPDRISEITQYPETASAQPATATTAKCVLLLLAVQSAVSLTE